MPRQKIDNDKASIRYPKVIIDSDKSMSHRYVSDKMFAKLSYSKISLLMSKNNRKSPKTNRLILETHLLSLK